MLCKPKAESRTGEFQRSIYPRVVNLAMNMDPGRLSFPTFEIGGKKDCATGGHMTSLTRRTREAEKREPE